MKRRVRRGLVFLAGGALGYVASSYFAGRKLADRLISARGLGPTTTARDDLIRGLRAEGARVEDFRHAGSPRVAAKLAAVFASPSEPSKRATILFLHGKGGSSAEWLPDARRALRLGYNVLVPDLRGHRPSEGEFVTYGFLEKEDLGSAIETAHEHFGLDPSRLGIHACSAGSTIALEFAAGRDAIHALWLESPYADPAAMARHYIALATGLPRWLLALTTRSAIRAAVTRVRRQLHVTDPRAGLASIDPVGALSRVRARVCLVQGERDRLVPVRFAARLEEALNPRDTVWKVPSAGHCHHSDEAESVSPAEYEKRWTDFFEKNLPPQG